MRLTRPEITYYLLAPRAYEKWLDRKSKRNRRRGG